LSELRINVVVAVARLTDRGLGIPLVLVLLEGGYDAIDDVHTSLENKIPVVVCAGTGRAADIIAYASEHMIVEKCVFAFLLSGVVFLAKVNDAFKFSPVVMTLAVRRNRF
jgi:hypothetical protein